MNKNFLVLTEASKKIGYGHLSRCIFLSQKLKTKNNITFISKLNIKNYLPKNFNFLELKNLSKNNKFDNLIIDLKFINKKYLRLIKDLNIKNKILIYYQKNIKLNPKLTIIPYALKPPYPDQKKVIFGKDALFFSQKLLKIAKKKKNFKQTKNFKITICFGGSDPKDYTFKIIQTLTSFKFSNFFFNVIIGNLYDKKNEIKLNKKIKNFKNFKVFRNPKNIYKILNKSDFAIINSGNIKYELAALGVPFFLIANDKKSKIFCKFFSNEFKFFFNKNFNFPKKVYLYSLLNDIFKKNKTLINFAKFNKKKIDLNSIDNVVKRINNIV